MRALRHGPDLPRDRLPALAFVVADEDVAVGGAGEDRRAARPHVQHEAFDVAVDVRGQATFEVLPVLAAVPAARDARVGGLRVAPVARTTERAGHEHGVRIARIHDDLVGVADARRAIGELLPRLAGVVAAVSPDAVAHEQRVGTRARDHDAVHVLEEPAELTPRLAAVYTLEQAADLDGRVDRVGRARIER